MVFRRILVNWIIVSISIEEDWSQLRHTDIKRSWAERANYKKIKNKSWKIEQFILQILLYKVCLKSIQPFKINRGGEGIPRVSYQRPHQNIPVRTSHTYPSILSTFQNSLQKILFRDCHQLPCILINLILRDLAFGRHTWLSAKNVTQDMKNNLFRLVKMSYTVHKIIQRHFTADCVTPQGGVSGHVQYGPLWLVANVHQSHITGFQDIQNCWIHYLARHWKWDVQKIPSFALFVYK